MDVHKIKSLNKTKVSEDDKSYEASSSRDDIRKTKLEIDKFYSEDFLKKYFDISISKPNKISIINIGQ
jgi:hypothetical protein